MRTLYRSRRDRWITGLCGGLAEAFGIRPGLLRLLLVVSIPFSSGTTILIYLVASLVISKEPYTPYDPYAQGPGGWQQGGPGGYDSYQDSSYNQRQPQGRNSFGSNPFGGNSFGGNPFQQQQSSQTNRTNDASNLDAMMEDIEKKAMKKELEELRLKLSKLEKEDK
ncbi:phage shock protein PspC (stress-responsive transcriptional regulator) [Paenibacillus shirakamiensis]|uniref:Phage shock protein PspC (Stress-responsive transcriptional regulator) n=1 Tax=Paenibacillus shirakamiensis TaxID=1265935 RepID=A0ABS4JJY3_9BACL|nr:PspC domain-containing protein [Paenibacillus shirakamiensis]MBP2002018.1 phage shock protein PspC (stress-responsive transcriptional regulator) [Paenibacillus shirakamiensis]